MSRRKSLMNVLKKNEDKIVRIGTVDGGCWMYIGEASNTELIASIFKNYKTNIEKKIPHVKKQLIELAYSNPEPSKDDIKNGLDHDEYYLSMSYARKIAYLCNYLDSTINFIDNYKDPFERMVVDSYFSIENNELCITIPGREQGKFWTKAEFDAKYS